MISFTVRTPTALLNKITDQVQRTPALMGKAFEREVRKSIQRVKPQLTTAPARLPALPFVWSHDPVKNARARRWYFANKVKGRKGGRYRRTGQLGRSWRFLVERNPFMGVYRIENSYRGALYVQGERQVPSHRATGWSRVDEVIAQETATFARNLEQIWYTVSDPYAGVPQT